MSNIDRRQGSGPEASPDFLGGAPRRGIGVKRLNHLPLLFGMGAAVAIAGAVIYTYNDRLSAAERQANNAQSAVAPADANALFRDAPSNGLIAAKTEPKPSPTPPPVLTDPAPAKPAPAAAPVKDDYERQLVERYRADMDKLERDRRNAWANALQADTTVKATGSKPPSSSVSTLASMAGSVEGTPSVAQLASMKEAALQRAGQLEQRGGGGQANAGAVGGGGGRTGAGGVGLDAALAAYDPDPNKQQSKTEFLSDTPANGQYLNEKRVATQSRCEIKAGTVIPSVLIGGVNSDLPGQIIGQVSENVWDSATGRCLMIPQGTRLVGTYDNKVSYGQERVLVAWQWLKLPDGSSVNIELMPGSDQSGYAGFTDKVDNHYWRIFGNALLLSAISAGVSLSQSDTTTSTTSSAETVTAAMGVQLGQVGMSFAQKGLNVQPTLIIRNGYRFNVMVTKDMVLPEWRGHPMERR